ncbi:MAG TPA: alpha-1,4-glucan--maltose-1-phosphate maltosyltransferase [Candidatus Limnocylindrales bacterium]|nr:alpha-1,4-glucan--maltose-1-phosphate maltosyltransferase [Candidatus Limnocylindrales bacterium]
MSDDALLPEATAQPARIVIERVTPEVDGGRYAVKRVVGEPVTVEADIFTDGHDAISAVLGSRHEGDADWTETPMRPLGNDRFAGEFTVTDLTRYRYRVCAWIDPFKTWSADLAKRLEAGQPVEVELLSGVKLVEAASRRAHGPDAVRLRHFARSLAVRPRRPRAVLGLDPELGDLMSRYAARESSVTYDRGQAILVERVRARFSTWYECFPRSTASQPGRHGTFKDLEARLPYIAGMGFDVLYLPPIHPIGTSFRKGKNNALKAAPDDVGSPWAIGSARGGHLQVHPQLGSLSAFRRLLDKARQAGLEIALDLAFQATPDHPYVREHPEWFRLRPDGSIQYAENPPKKYQDIYPFDFGGPAWRELWAELLKVVLFWAEQGVMIFRVDNPHTKPFAFWEWLIAQAKARYPEMLFLSEAFTRPRVMYELAKLGFSQSYTYFAWRNTSWELRDYFTELTRPPVREFFRAHLWPNTPDILTEYLQQGGRPAFAARLVLAATLGANYGIYGPAFELGEQRALAPGSEEYLDSEKYEIRYWDLDQPHSLRELITRVNAIRRAHVALQSDWSLRFHGLDNDQLLAYSKRGAAGDDVILTVVNLDPHATQRGWVHFPPVEAGVQPEESYQVHDLLSDARYIWSGTHHYIELDPHVSPAHIFRIRRRLRRESDFEYFA